MTVTCHALAPATTFQLLSNAKFQLLYHTQTVRIKQLSNTLCKVTQQSRGDGPGNTVAELVLSQFTPSCANTGHICLQQFNNSIDHCSVRSRLWTWTRLWTSHAPKGRQQDVLLAVEGTETFARSRSTAANGATVTAFARLKKMRQSKHRPIARQHKIQWTNANAPSGPGDTCHFISTVKMETVNVISAWHSLLRMLMQAFALL